MSKHPSNTIKSRLLRRGLAGILSLALLLSLIPSTVLTARAAGWEDQYIQTLVDWGVMRGDIGGNMAPTRSITRAEFVTMMNRAYGYKTMGGHPFTDVRLTSWYNDDIDIGYNIGYFKGTSPTTASPNDTLTREQAAVLLARNMMLQPTVGETLGFSDSRSLSEWSRGLVGAAAENGIISGYDDGSFQPFRNITRGEVAAMLVRAIGTPIQEAGDHALGNVYGNVTVNTAGVKLRDGVIAGNLYLTGGIDLGDVLLENVTVLGQIIVSGGGESNSSQSSVILRNVVADGMIVDSIGEQFVTIRAEGNTDIPTTTVRTNAYVDDSSLPGYGLSYIELDGAEGALYQLAGNIKNVVNKTPGSDMQIVQGTADKVTVDEAARDSSVFVDGDAQVGDLNLDTGTDVTGTGDIKNLNVGAPGSSVEQLPDNIVIRPGIDADIAGSNMNSTQGAQSSAEPKLLAGYPAVRKIAPQSAELVFRVNKPGTIYWAVSSVADGSVSEADLLEPPVYGNKVLASGKVTATAANTDYTAAVNKLTSGGSYYVTAMLVDGRDEHSPIKVTSFTTPDDSVPAFATGYPVMTLVSTEIAQVTVMTTKSCLLYYALLPKGAKAPTEAEFKSAAIPGNLGYGSQSVTKNVTIPINVNSVPLEEKTNYVLYLWLVDHDGAQKSKVTALPFTTLDETPPNVTYMSQTDQGPNSVKLEYTIDESPADLIWAIVTEGNHNQKQFLNYEWEEIPEPGDENRFTLNFKGDEASLLAAKVRLVSGTGALAKGVSKGSPLTISGNALAYVNAKTSSFVVYYIAHDRATASANLSEQIKGIRVHTEDTIKPTAELRFTNPDNTEVSERPQANADVRIIFSEGVKGTTTKDKDIFLTLYSEVKQTGDDLANSPGDTDKTDAYNTARNALAKALDTYMKLYSGTPDGPHEAVTVRNEENESTVGADWVVDWRNAVVEPLDDGSGRIQVRLPHSDISANSALNLVSGASYYFHLAGIFDLATPPNELDPSPCDLKFITRSAQVQLEEVTERPPLMNNITETNSDNDPRRIDLSFTLKSLFESREIDPEMCYDILFWSDRNMEITLYSRPLNSDGTINSNANWIKEGTMLFMGAGTDNGGEARIFRSMNTMKRAGNLTYATPSLKDMGYLNKEYAIHVDRLEQLGPLSGIKDNWNDVITMGVSVVAGDSRELDDLSIVGSNYQKEYDDAVPGKGLFSIGTPDPFEPDIRFTRSGAPEITQTRLTSVSDTNAEIGFTMGGSSGKVNYLIIRLRNVKYGTDKTHTGATDPVDVSTILSQIANGGYDTEQIVSIKGADGKDINYPAIKNGNDNIIPPIGEKDGKELSAPTWETVKNGYFSGSEDIRKGTTSLVMQGRTTYITGLSGWLKPNNIYFVVAVPEGETVNSCSDEAMCYYFTTKPSSRPTLTLSGSWATDVTASVDMTSTVTSKLLVQSLIGEGNTAFLKEPFGGTKGTDGTITGSHLRDDVPSTIKTAYEGNEDFTILDALYEPATLEPQNLNGDHPSIFDAYADTDTQNRLIQFLTAPGTSNVVKDASSANITLRGSATINSEVMKFSNKDLQKTVPYVCIAMAMGSESKTYGFRAVPNLMVKDDDKPTLTAVGTVEYKKNDDGKDVIIGEIELIFDQIIYMAPTGYSRRPVVQSPSVPPEVVAEKYYGLGAAIRCTATNGLSIPDAGKPAGSTTVDDTKYTETRVVTVEINRETTNPNFSIVIQGLCNSSGTPMDTCTVYFDYDVDSKFYKEPRYVYSTRP